MSRLLAVAARELRERWLLFPGGLAVGLVPVALPLVGMKRDDAPVVGLFFAVLFGVIAAVVAGSSILARDTANGRMGFLFSRPIAWPQIWAGKWVAALVLVAGGGFLAALPWMAAYPPETHGGSWLAALVDARGTVFFLSLLFLGIGFANYNATAFRSRSAWLAVDLVLLLVALWAVRRYLAPLLFLGVLDPGGGWAPYVGLAPLGVALVLASAVQVAVGRTDVRRAHRAMSIAFWSVIGTGLLAAALFLHWALAAGPADLRGGFVATPDPTGRWVFVQGASGRGVRHHPGLLIDSSTGEFLPPAREDVSQPWAARGIAFSGDGRRAVRWRSGWSDKVATVEVLDLQARSVRATRVVLESAPPLTWRTRVRLSPAGARLLVVHESGASLFALDGRRVATATLPPGTMPEAARFLDEDRARAWLGPDPAGRHGSRAGLLVTLGSDGSATTNRFDFVAGTTPPPVSARTLLVPADEGRRLLSLDGGLRLRDGATGALLATLDEGHAQGRALGLADGRIVFVAADGPRVLVRTFDREGRPLGSFTLLRSPHGLAGVFEVPSGRVALGFEAPYRQAEVVVIDLANGREVERLSGLALASEDAWLGLSDEGAGSGVRAARFLWAPDQLEAGAFARRRLVRMDFATGERKTVLGPDAPRAERVRVAR